MPSWSRYVFNEVHAEPYDLGIQGLTFNVSAEASVTTATPIYFEFRTSTKTPVILHYMSQALDASCRFTIYEAPTLTIGTTEIPSVNTHRQIGTTATMKMYSNPTSVSAGTTLSTQIVGSGDHRSGGTTDDAAIWTLKTNTSYVAKVENLGNQTATYNFTMTWRELT